MRTRFLCTDYSVSSVIQATDFLRLPLPHLPLSSSSEFEDLHRFDQLSIFSIDLGIKQLPIEKALSKFLSESFPNFIDVEICDFDKAPSHSEKAASSKLTSSISNQNAEEGSILIDGKQDTIFDSLQYEIPELHSILLPMHKSAFYFEDMRILTDISFAEKKEMPSPETMLQYPLYSPQSIYAVDEIHSPTFVERKVDYLEDGGSIQGQYLSLTTQFPLFEVDEAGLGILSDIPTKNRLLIFGSIEIQYSMGGDGMSNSEGLLDSRNVDFLECVSDQCLLANRFKMEIPFLNYSFEADIISFLEQRENSDGGSICLRSPMIFEELQLFDSSCPSHFSEVLSDAKLKIEKEMPLEATSLRSFDELVVCQELTMIDSSFKSLPVPLFPDKEKTRSLHSHVEEILFELDTLHFFVSDDLYLDWHILEEVNHTCNADSLFSKVLEDVYNIDSALELGDSEKLVYDFILSGDSPKASNKEENKEILHININDIPEFPLPLGEKSSSKLHISRNREASTGGESSKIVAKNISLLAGSFSQFNDLDFLLNPQDYTRGKEHKQTNQIPDFGAVDWNNSDSQKKNPHSLSSLGGSDKLEKQQSFISVENNYDSGCIETFGGDEVCSTMLPQCAPFDRSEQVHTNDYSFPDTIIVVNTQNFDKQMVISRRNTYQKILALEKKGAQVIERDLHHPVDVIISAAICIAWYDCKNIAKKATSSDEAFSCLPLCVENIAASILTSLSFAFSGCILVFEGENSFLDGIMESSDELYAAAASLGIDIQIFCSYCSEMTENIILSCIEAESRTNRGLFPKVSELETLAESFLTMFPSINPLSAHAILSSVSMLLEFLEWSPEHRFHVVQKYQVSYESISLLSALSRYGEREESKSGMTECSSSVSSVPGSEPLHFGSNSGMRKRKYAGNLQDLEDSLLCTSDPNYSWISEKTDIFDELGKSSLSFDNNLFGQPLGLETNMTMNPHNSSQPYDFQIARDPELGDEMNKADVISIGACFPPRQTLDGSAINKMDRQSGKDSRNAYKDFIGEVIDIEDTHAVSKKISTANCAYLSPLLHEVDQDLTTRIPKAARKLSFGTSNLSTFPTSDKIDSCSDVWISIRDQGQSSRERINWQPGIGINRNSTLLEYNNGVSGGGQSQKEVQNLHDHLLQERNTVTPLSSAINSSQLLQGSPWTIEFLNRIREKSRSRQHSILSKVSAPSYGYPRTRSKGTKRSPSIFEFYKYQGQGASERSIEQKKQKRFIRPSSSSKVEMASASHLPTWTPIDKKAKQTLSFATNGSGGQTKLVWSDRDSHTPGRRF
ncbi:PREDICTED: uncharacterized protein LOC109186838 isoform X1 [Ipomoea nil]|uniref:uncharacterized protein LOC109186838 isoform X1 n=2 Tax=Ipomoea nil TaxID=35883 RepID=UPI000901A11C|nr:PREDICTED: uncharacterized protein LOC109186838 isoform X1 [Ipomoea nil]